MRMNTGKKLFLCAGLLAFFLSVSAQSYSLRTNVIGLATTNLNLEASMTLNRKWSLHLPVQYNPFKFGRNRQFRNFYAAPGVRYWLLESYRWMKGAGKKVIVYRNRPQRPELMYKLFDGIFPTAADVARFLKEFDEMNNHAVV